ncbi:MAG: MBL fold metallo-hydrolase [Parachlamydiaceae bacterium]|nr:MBL fold metallo-hydrolase [Parachlamydiaceae bacterium]
MKYTKASFTFLGTGGSMGIPVIGCSCNICKSINPYNVRLRPSGLIRVNGKTILIDCGPDFRIQALTHQIKEIDALILTHAHHDHTAGLDEMRIFTLRSGKPLPCLLSSKTLQELKIRFYYIFNDRYSDKGIKLTTDLALNCIENSAGELPFEGLNIRYMDYSQGGMQVNGFRFGNLAYVTDIKEYSPDIFSTLEGVEILILSALRHTPSHLHFTVDDAIEFAQRVGAKQTWLTHIAHELEHDRTNVYLPDPIKLGYDGLEFNFNAELS